MPKKFHLGWFTSFAVDEWNDTFGAGGSPWDGTFYVDLAKAMERACFDYLMIEDTLMLSEAYGGTSEAYLESAVMVPKHDPAPLAALIGAATTHLGIVSTLSTMAYPPPQALPARAPLLDARPYLQRSLRLEHRDERRGHGRAELRPGQVAAARIALRHGGGVSGARQRIVRLLAAGRRAHRSRA